MPAIYFLDEKLSETGTSKDWRREWLRMLGNAAQPIVWNGRDYVSAGGDKIERCDTVIAHDNPFVFEIAGDQGREHLWRQSTIDKFYVILVSGSYARDEDRIGLPQNVYRRYQPVSARGFDASFARCFERFWEKLCANGGMPNFKLLEPDSPSPLALRFLCEAWQIVNVEGKMECSGIPIHAPDTLAEWLAPFGSGATASGVAALMGEVKGAATNLLNALEHPKENNVQDAVSAYLAAVASKQ